LKDLSILIPDPHFFFRLGKIATIPNAIALFGLLLFFTLHRFRFASAFLLSILACWAIALTLGLTPWKGIAALPPSPLPSLLQLNLIGALHPSLWGILISIILINIIDSTASLSALSRMAHAVDERGRIKNIDRILIPDGTGSMLSALLGTTTLSYFLESSSGIKAGGRTGLTALVAALCSLICLFFYPLISSIPLYASTPALIAIGCFMAQEVKRIPWQDWTDYLPALLTLVSIPLTFNIYRGFAIGFISFALLKALTGQWKKVHPICWCLALIFALHLAWAISTNHL
jgi:AGZA family xanthine/uracil permease-like MFS transporter